MAVKNPYGDITDPSPSSLSSSNATTRLNETSATGRRTRSSRPYGREQNLFDKIILFLIWGWLGIVACICLVAVFMLLLFLFWQPEF